MEDFQVRKIFSYGRFSVGWIFPKRNTDKILSNISII